MAKTLKLNVNFPMSIVLHSETVKDFQGARQEAREIIASGKVLKGHTKYRIELMAGDKTDEQCFEQIYREGIREFIKKDLVNELQGNESRIRVGDVKVTFEKPPEAPYCCCEQLSKLNGLPCICTNCTKLSKRWTTTV